MIVGQLIIDATRSVGIHVTCFSHAGQGLAFRHRLPPTSRLPALGTKTVPSTNAGNTQQIRASASCKPYSRVRERDTKTKSITTYSYNQETRANAQPYRCLSETTGREACRLPLWERALRVRLTEWMDISWDQRRIN